MNIMALTDMKGVDNDFDASVGPAFVGESLFIFDNDGKSRVPLTNSSFRNARIVVRETTLTKGENDEFVRLSLRLDDALSQAIAIAELRNLVLLTDDEAGIAVAEALGIAVLTTLDVAISWSVQLSTLEVAAACRRLRERARYPIPSSRPTQASWYRAHI